MKFVLISSIFFIPLFTPFLRTLKGAKKINGFISMQEYLCKICGNSLGNKPMIVHEKMFNLHDEFVYFQCATCGCLQIIEPPENIAKYYSFDKYYSYHLKAHKNSKLANIAKSLLAKGYLMGIIPSWVSYIEGSRLSLLKNIEKTTKILDIGCGNGMYLQQMYLWGFKNLTGIDPYIENDISYPCGIKIYKQDIYDHKGDYGLVMMHHSFEHMNMPLDVLKECYRLLTPGGRLLIRIPVSDCFAFRKYGVNWFQIDAPRHFFLHTSKSMSILADEAGFEIENIKYDSMIYQFTESEAYSRRSKLGSNYFKISSKTKKMFQKQTKLLNILHDGDQACFIMKKRNF